MATRSTNDLALQVITEQAFFPWQSNESAKVWSLFLAKFEQVSLYTANYKIRTPAANYKIRTPAFSTEQSSAELASTKQQRLSLVYHIKLVEYLYNS